MSDAKPSAVAQAPGKPSARERILAAAVRQIAREGIDGVRIARIAMEARVSSALIHYHFATRDALLAEALEYSYAHAGEARIASEEELPTASHAERLQWMIEQCLPTTPRLEEDWVLWVELWLRAVRHTELRPVAEELYARLHQWFAEEIAAGVQAGEFDRCDPDEVADRAMALLDGYGIRTLIGDGAMPLERARDSVSRALARDLFSADLFPTDLSPSHPADLSPTDPALQAREPAPSAARAASRPVRTAPSM